MTKGDGRGGFRPGAGRKPILGRPKRFSLVLEEDTHDELARLADSERVAPAVYVRQVLEAHVRAKLRRRARAGAEREAPPGRGAGGSRGERALPHPPVLPRRSADGTLVSPEGQVPGDEA